MAALQYSPACVDCSAPVWIRSIRCAPCSRVARRNPGNNFVCEHCGKQAARKVGGANKKKNYKSRWCSMRCKVAWSKEHQVPRSCRVWFRVCSECRRWFAARRQQQRACSVACTLSGNRRRVKARYTPRPPTRKQCATCGLQFEKNNAMKYCSKRCARFESKLSGAAYSRLKYGMSRREWERIRLIVLKRYEYVCYLCGLATNPHADPSDSRYPNAEHVKPVSKGGQTTLLNLRCACRGCNMTKSDRLAHPAIALSC